MARLDVCATAELPVGSARLLHTGTVSISVYNIGGVLYALENRCSHDDGPLAEGEFDAETGVAVCPRHSAQIDIRSGRPLTLPAVLPVATYPVAVEDGRVVVELDS